MIIFENKTFHKNENYPDTDWVGGAKWIIPDSSTELCNKVNLYYPNFEIVEDEDGNVIDVIPNQYLIKRYISNKISEMSRCCFNTIIKGIDINDKHYSLTVNDQINLERIKLGITSETEYVVYHADGELNELYTVEAFLALYDKTTYHINYNTIYFNQLKDMIKNMTDIDSIISCEYGMELDEEHKANLDKLMKG